MSYVHSLGFRPATHFKLWTVFSVVSTPSHAIRLHRGEKTYHLFFPSYFYVYRRPFLRYWLLFARKSLSTITNRQFSGIRFSLTLLGLRFGTEISLCWRWQSLCGSAMLRSTSKVSPFPPHRRPGISYKHGLGTDIIRVNCQSFCYSSFFVLNLSVASLRLGPYTPRLWDSYRSQPTRFHPHNNFRHGLASVRARRFTRHASSRRYYVWSGPPPLETSEMSAVVLLIHNFQLWFYPFSFVRESYGSYSAASPTFPHL